MSSRVPVKDRYYNALKVAEENGLVSPVVHIGQFKEDCKLLLTDEDMNAYSMDEITQKTLCETMDIDEETLNELEEVCSPSNLRCSSEGEIVNWDDILALPHDYGLETLHHWKKQSREHSEKWSRKKNCPVKSKYSELDCALKAKWDQVDAKSNDDKIACPEVVVTVRVCFPISPRRFKACDVDFNVLGCQTLDELRDKIPCALDHQPVGTNFSDDPNQSRDVTLADMCTSSFFFLENTFYNDYRSTANLDLGRMMIEWSEKAETPVPDDCVCASMSDMRFSDLRIRLGAPYIFLHQGDCEHQVIFKDIRLLNASDCRSRSSYPFAVSRGRFKTIPCKVCTVLASTWLTRFDQLSDEDPSFFCDGCFRTLHYDKHGKKLGTFVAEPYVNFAGLLY